jgi:hypothetical protein
MLKPSTEPILRKQYRARAREAAQELKDSDQIMKSFFRKGGRSTYSNTRGQFVRRKRYGGASFPREANRFRPRFSRFKNNKYSQGPKTTTKKSP